MTAAARRLVHSLDQALPRGHSLPDDVWRRRHKALLGLLAVHPFGIALYALGRGFGVVHALGEAAAIAAIAVLAAVATRKQGRRKLAAGLVSFGLISCSAVVVHMSGGLIEAHFHFFVMLSILLLYEDWFPYLLAFAYVAVHHGVVGTLDAASVYNHPGALENPWKWAAIHAVFISAAGVANIVAWRLNEDVRAETRAAYRQARASTEELRKERIHLTEAEQLAHLGSWDWDVRTNEMTWSSELFRILGREPGAFEPSYERFFEHVHPDDRARLDAAVRNAVETRASYECEFRVLRSGGDVRTVHTRGKLIVDDDSVPVRMVGAIQDVTERTAIEQEREQLLAREREQVERLRELDRLKDAFVASVSHELRTPLTSIRGYLELVLDGEGGELTADQERFLQVVDRNAERLLRLVGDLLFVAQVDAGTIALELSGVDLVELAEESVTAARPAAATKGVDLILTAEGLPTIAGDRARLAQLLDNLISNAVKFTPAGGRVDLRVFADDGKAVVEVHDTGIGIPASEQVRLFERFFRASSATEQAIQGTGLGLSIAKAISEAHGGTIAVASEEGEGTTFRVELPLLASARMAHGATERIEV